MASNTTQTAAGSTLTVEIKQMIADGLDDIGNGEFMSTTSDQRTIY